ncbi:MAG: response regulator [Acidimicrobiia bacterium]
MAAVLIIDDSRFQRGVIRRAVEAAGHEALEAADGHAGLERSVAVAPDVVLMDLVMPGIDGMELLGLFRERGFTAPVVVLTSDVQDSTRARCLDLGAAAFVNKPVQEVELRAVIDDVLGLAAQRIEG